MEERKELGVNEIAAIIGVGVVSLVFILVAVLGLQEFIVSVCCLLILEAGMTVLLHKAEVWKHGVMLAAQLLAGIVIGRIALVLICMTIYVVFTIALYFITKK